MPGAADDRPGLAGGGSPAESRPAEGRPAEGRPEEVPAAAGRVFGADLDRAVRYHDLLAGPGVERGLLGPREVPRLWSRHLLNCAALAPLIPAEAAVVDVGSGAGLPGLVLALARPDLRIICLEPLQRRAAFLTEMVGELDLADRVTVRRARAEEVAAGRRGVVDPVTADVAVARAVAALPKLVGWLTPLLRAGGVALALKGERAAAELADPALVRVVHKCGGSDPQLTTVRVGAEPVRVIRWTRESGPQRSGPPDRSRWDRGAAGPGRPGPNSSGPVASVSEDKEAT